MNTRVSSNSLALFYPQYNGGQSQATGRDQPTGDSSRRGLQNREDTATSEFIFSGELLESISEDKRYLPEYNQQIAPYNRYAIEIYLNIEAMLGVSDPRGRLLDQFV